MLCKSVGGCTVVSVITIFLVTSFILRIKHNLHHHRQGLRALAGFIHIIHYVSNITLWY